MIKICLFVVAMMLVGCTEIPKKVPAWKQANAKAKDDAKGIPWSHVHHYEYKGHKYIKFASQGNQGGPVHDPDCPCFSRNKEK